MLKYGFKNVGLLTFTEVMKDYKEGDCVEGDCIEICDYSYLSRRMDVVFFVELPSQRWFISMIAKKIATKMILLSRSYKNSVIGVKINEESVEEYGVIDISIKFNKRIQELDFELVVSDLLDIENYKEELGKYLTKEKLKTNVI